MSPNIVTRPSPSAPRRPRICSRCCRRANSTRRSSATTCRPILACARSSRIPDPGAAGRDFLAAHGFIPVNHLVVVQAPLAQERPDIIGDLVRMLRESAGAAALPQGGAALGPALALAIRYARQQGLLPRDMTVEEAWAGLPPGLD